MYRIQWFETEGEGGLGLSPREIAKSFTVSMNYEHMLEEFGVAENGTWLPVLLSECVPGGVFNDDPAESDNPETVASWLMYHREHERLGVCRITDDGDRWFEVDPENGTLVDVSTAKGRALFWFQVWAERFESILGYYLLLTRVGLGEDEIDTVKPSDLGCYLFVPRVFSEAYVEVGASTITTKHGRELAVRIIERTQDWFDEYDESLKVCMASMSSTVALGISALGRESSTPEEPTR